jgi:Oxidoreductase molybdopterin binding domain
MERIFLLSALLFALVFSSASLQCQQLTIQTDSGKQVVLSRTDLEALPHIKVTASEHSSPVNFEGITLKSALEKAGIVFGESMKGKRLSNCLLVEAADGYRVVIALPELDPAFTDKQILLVFLRDGKPLGEKEGPYRSVIPDEKRMARWVRQITNLRIVDVQ